MSRIRRAVPETQRGEIRGREADKDAKTGIHGGGVAEREGCDMELLQYLSPWL